MILYVGELEERLGFTEQIIKQYQTSGAVPSHVTVPQGMKASLNFYELIVLARNTSHFQLVNELQTKRKEVFPGHKVTIQFQALLKGYNKSDSQRKEIIDYLLKLNASSIIPTLENYHLYFCLDDSGSMSGQPWNDLIRAVAAFCSKRIAMVSSKGGTPQDLVTIINHNHMAEIMCKNQPITSNPERHSRFRSGGNDFSRVLCVADQEISNCAFNTYLPVLLFMSDGGCGNGEREIEMLAKKFPSLKVFTIGFGSGCDNRKLQNMANLTGGTFAFGNDGPSLVSTFETISVKLSETKFTL
eukprot:TRINITY_DN9500_c0_g1_i1.p1 TRINITY_DN9500_c0_g1~~TRINITY_DN9500_c0_g1_i1.p1  ORF type:complete len:300 (-),score=61.90 TRINITY_DN9500_c0_g1_i1:91-990(-)